MATCANHPETAATAYCRTCGKPMCDACKREVKGVIYCEECIAARLQGTLPQVDPATPGAIPPLPAPSAPNVAVATFLGFIPGMGAVYNGQFTKGFAHIVIFGLLIGAMNVSEIFVPFFLAFFAYMVVDANRTANARGLGRTPPDYLGLNSLFGGTEEAPGARAATGNVFDRAGATLDAAARSGNKGPIAAVILIGLGCLFLLNTLDVFEFQFTGRFWPVLLIAFGLWLGYQRWTSVEGGEV